MSRSDITLDDQRACRLGFDEAVYCEGKRVRQIAAVLARAEGQAERMLLTRLDADKFASLPPGQRQRMDYDARSRTRFWGAVSPPRTAPRVVLVTAGTSDDAVRREAARTLHYYGHASRVVADVGVAGLWRLLERVDEIRQMPVVIVFAGMDGALPSVVGGLVPGVVIAVPTSVGYGVAAGGDTALRASLSSCSPGLVVVNIDNGYGAACAAMRALGVGLSKERENNPAGTIPR